MESPLVEHVMDVHPGIQDLDNGHFEMKIKSVHSGRKIINSRPVRGDFGARRENTLGQAQGMLLEPARLK